MSVAGIDRGGGGRVGNAPPFAGGRGRNRPWEYGEERWRAGRLRLGVCMVEHHEPPAFGIGAPKGKRPSSPSGRGTAQERAGWGPRQGAWEAKPAPEPNAEGSKWRAAVQTAGTCVSWKASPGLLTARPANRRTDHLRAGRTPPPVAESVLALTRGDSKEGAGAVRKRSALRPRPE